MPKGYWIPHIDVRDPEGYKAYTAATPAAHEKYRGVALVRGGRYEVVEGRGRARNVLREFPDYAAALACYRSEEYQRARPLRLQNAECDFIIAEGYEGAQPPSSSAAPPATARKGYWIGHIDVFDPKATSPIWLPTRCALPISARAIWYGAAPPKCRKARRARTVVIEFPSYEAALACYRSGEYQAAKKLREGKGQTDLVIVEGYDGAKF